MVGIIAFGGYVPRLRMQRKAIAAAHAWFNGGLTGLASGERAVANWDEDAVTMAVEASRSCLGNRNRSQVDRVVLASTSLPNADRQNSAIVKEALNLPDDISAFDVTSSQRAGVSALLDAFHAAAGGAGNILCVASERRRARAGSEAEILNGDASAATLIGNEAAAAVFLAGHSLTMDFVDHFRSANQPFDYHWEARWARDEGYGKIAPLAINKALEKAGIKAADVDHFIMGAPIKGVHKSVARSVGISPEAVIDPLIDQMGNTGAAHPIVMLVHTLETAAPGARIVVVGFGQGCDVVVLEVQPEIEAARPATAISAALASGKPEENYLKFLAFSGNLDLEKGMRAEMDQKPILTALYRDRKSILGLVGGRCMKTGTIQFPKTPISVAQGVHMIHTQEDYPLAERPACIFSYTADHLTYTPDPPAYYGAVEFAGGGRLTTDFTDIDIERMEVGAPMRMVFRVKAIDERRGFTKYFWKATPDRSSSTLTVTKNSL